MEDVAVGEHGDERGDDPGRVAGSRSGEGESAPEKSEYAEGDGDFFGGEETDNFGEIVEHEIEEDVVPLPDGVESGGFSLMNEFDKPSVVEMAAEIAGFNVRVPEAWDYYEKRKKDKEKIILRKRWKMKIQDARLADGSVRCRGHFWIF